MRRAAVRRKVPRPKRPPARRGRAAGGRAKAAPAPSAPAATGATPGATPATAHLQHVGSGKYSDVFKVRTTRASPPVMMKLSYYRDDTVCKVIERVEKGDVRGAMRFKRRDAIQVGAAFSRFAAGLLGGVSPHFVVVFCNRDCPGFARKLQPLLTGRYHDLSPHQRRFNNVCFMEAFHTNLTKWLVTATYDEAVLRGIVFQVLYTLAAVQKRLPGFRHNDLSTNNVLVKRLRAPPLLAYVAGGGKTWYVRVPVLVALSDYDFTNVPGHPTLTNERVYSGKYRVDGRRNDSYDAHFFLKSVLKCILRRTADFPDTMAFLHRLKLKQEDRQNAAFMARLVPSTLLADAYFAPLTKRPAGHVGARYAM